jgi:hypothetical protein
MGCWFMAPMSRSASMKIRTLNGSSILKNFPHFLDSLKEPHLSIHNEYLKEYGLIVDKLHPEASFSPDAICSVVDVLHRRFLAGCEFKSQTTANTVAAEVLLAETYGKCQVINLSAPNSDSDNENREEDIYDADPEPGYLTR